MPDISYYRFKGKEEVIGVCDFLGYFINKSLLCSLFPLLQKKKEKATKGHVPFCKQSLMATVTEREKPLQHGLYELP